MPVGARATTDRVREAIFSILGEADGKKVLDLYAGSGALGLEALSRGAEDVCFVDISRHAYTAIHDNLSAFVPTQVSIHKKDALVFLKRNSEVFHWIFCDPPYDRVDYTQLLQTMVGSAALGLDSLLILEADRYHTLIIPEELELRDLRKFGDTIIYFLCRRSDVKGAHEFPPAS